VGEKRPPGKEVKGKKFSRRFAKKKKKPPRKTHKSLGRPEKGDSSIAIARKGGKGANKKSEKNTRLIIGLSGIRDRGKEEDFFSMKRIGEAKKKKKKKKNVGAGGGKRGGGEDDSPRKEEGRKRVTGTVASGKKREIRDGPKESGYLKRKRNKDGRLTLKGNVKGNRGERGSKTRGKCGGTAICDRQSSKPRIQGGIRKKKRNKQEKKKSKELACKTLNIGDAAKEKKAIAEKKGSIQGQFYKHLTLGMEVDQKRRRMRMFALEAKKGDRQDSIIKHEQKPGKKSSKGKRRMKATPRPKKKGHLKHKTS